MNYATLADLKTINSLFAIRRDVFPHIRQDKLKRQILAGQCIYEENVVVVFQKYKKRTRVGEVDIPAKSVMLHQIVSASQFNGAGGRVFDRFFEEMVPRESGLYLSVRAENTVACQFYERHGMSVVGKVAWSGGTLPGFLYHKQDKAYPKGFYSLGKREMKTIKISAKWMRQLFHSCTLEFIATTCHASCCENSTSPIGFVVTIHPVEQPRVDALGGVISNGLLQPPPDRKRKGKCPFKTPENLCGLHGTPDKPFGCIASPFTLNKAGKLVVRHRYINFKCFRAEGAMPVYRAQAGSFKAIFGDVEAARLTAHFDAGGGDTTGEIEDHIYAMLMDNDEIKRNRSKLS